MTTACSIDLRERVAAEVIAGEPARSVAARFEVAINRNLGSHSAVDPHLRRAAALIPQVNLRNDRINPHPDRAILMGVILAFVGWTGWLLIRPEGRAHPKADGTKQGPDA